MAGDAWKVLLLLCGAAPRQEALRV